MKPFVLLATRAQDDAADAEYAAFLRFGGLTSDELRPRAPGGRRRCRTSTSTGCRASSSGAARSTRARRRSPTSRSGSRRRCRRCSTRWSRATCRSSAPATASARSACTRAGSSTRRTASRSGPCRSRSPTRARADPLLAGLPSTFDAFVGHKEACRVLPATATLLASSPTCPVQMFRVRSNLYATQFHPELDVEGIVVRVRAYAEYGYFPPAELEEVVARVRAADVSVPPRILRGVRPALRPRLTRRLRRRLPGDDPVDRLADHLDRRRERQPHPPVPVDGVEVGAGRQGHAGLVEEPRAPGDRVEAARGDVGVQVERAVGGGDAGPAELRQPLEQQRAGRRRSARRSPARRRTRPG